MRLVAIAGLLGLVTAVVAITTWQLLQRDNDEVKASAEFDRIITYQYRPPLGEAEHPAVWVDDFPTVALVTVEGLHESRWSTISGEFEGRAGVMAGGLIYTDSTLRVEEYIKGSGPDSIQAAIRGGIADGIRMDMTMPLDDGDRAVVFVSDPHERYGGPIVENAYIFDGHTATSELDQKTLSVTELLDGLREAVAEQAGG